MVNDPMPWQPTVRQLRQALDGVPDDAVVGVSVPAGKVGYPHTTLTTLYGRLAFEYRDGPVFQIRVLKEEGSEGS